MHLALSVYHGRKESLFAFPDSWARNASTVVHLNTRKHTQRDLTTTEVPTYFISRSRSRAGQRICAFQRREHTVRTQQTRISSHPSRDCTPLTPVYRSLLKVWESYTVAAKLLLRPEGAGLVLCSTISENAPFMQELLGAKPCEFKPSIPNLVYQYSLYVNYDSKRLGAANPEIPSEG